MIGARRPVRSRQRLGALWLVLLLEAAACGRSTAPLPGVEPNSTLRVGFGLTSGTDPQLGILQSMNTLTTEALVTFTRDGRPQPWVAESWRTTPDHHVHLRLRPNVFFHDGSAVDSRAAHAASTDAASSAVATQR